MVDAFFISLLVAILGYKILVVFAVPLCGKW